MQVYLVGGAVRDTLLNYPIVDKDYVVTGATVQQMLDEGFSQVGKSFPVFLHPDNHQEYALARTEKKQGQGYTGFVCDFDPTITLEQDLIRRDLTINAMAQDQQGNIIDPYDGQLDLNSKILRHVSPAFIEDPLRVFRVARFYARYYHLGFTIAPETLELMSQIAKSGELESLSAERVWQETQSALNERSPWQFFQVLHQCNALDFWFSELNNLWGVPNPEKWHPEIDTGVHSLMVLEQACKLSNDTNIRFASLIHDLGKGLSPKEHWPHHHGHEKSGVKLVKQLCQRLKTPNEVVELASIVSEFHTHVHRVFELKAKTQLSLFDKTDAWRKPERFEQFLLCCTADMNGRKGFEDKAYPQAQFLRNQLQLANSVSVKEIVADGYKGKEIKLQLHQQRLDLLKQQAQTP